MSRAFTCVTLCALIGLMIACGGSGGSANSPPPGQPPGSGSPATVPGVFTYHGDNARTGLNAGEGALKPANVNSTQFGKLFSDPVDGQIYAQPLYMAGVNIGGATHNVVFVATQHDSVYAFDADKAGAPLWQVSFLGTGVTTASSCLVQSHVLQIVPEVGITGTPVIDPTTNTIYVAAETSENGVLTFKLHALDITSGAEKGGSPVVIQGSVPGASPFLNDGTGKIVFSPGDNSLRAIQRSALLLANGNVYVAFASHEDIEPYHGWVFAYNAGTLAQTGVFNTTPNGAGTSNAGKGGIWMSGAGPSADASGNVFAGTGNGTFDANTGGIDFGDTLLKLAPGLSVADWFTPFNEATLQTTDHDLGSGGVLLVPDQTAGPPHLAITGSKGGTVYVVDRDSMGHFNPTSDAQIVQSLSGAVGPLFSTPAYFNGQVFFGGRADTPKAFTLRSGKLKLASNAATTFGYPGATPTVSANGSADGIVWMLQTDGFARASSCSTLPEGAPAVLHAYDTADLAHELYNSNQAGSRDHPGGAIKFTVPTVANGKVYVGTQNQLTVFGLLQ